VIVQLNNRIEDHDIDRRQLAVSYEEQIDALVASANERIAALSAQLAEVQARDGDAIGTLRAAEDAAHAQAVAELQSQVSGENTLPCSVSQACTLLLHQPSMCCVSIVTLHFFSFWYTCSLAVNAHVLTRASLPLPRTHCAFSS